MKKSFFAYLSEYNEGSKFRHRFFRPLSFFLSKEKKIIFAASRTDRNRPCNDRRVIFEIVGITHYFVYRRLHSNKYFVCFFEMKIAVSEWKNISLGDVIGMAISK